MEQFFQWLIDRYESLYVTFIVRPYERAVHIRRGKLKRVCKPGIYFKLPLELDQIVKVNVVTTTSNLKTQVVMREDGTSVVVGVVIRWRVREEAVDRLVIDLEDYETVLADTTLGMVARVFIQSKASMSLPEMQAKILEAVRRRLGKFGFDVEDIYITDVANARTFRLVSGEG